MTDTYLYLVACTKSVFIITGTHTVQNIRVEAKEVYADLALARRDDVHGHRGQQSDGREESCSTGLHETEGKVNSGCSDCADTLDLPH